MASGILKKTVPMMMPWKTYELKGWSVVVKGIASGRGYLQEVKTSRQHITADDLNLTPHDSGDLLRNGEHEGATKEHEQLESQRYRDGFGTHFFIPLLLANSARAL